MFGTETDKKQVFDKKDHLEVASEKLIAHIRGNA